MRGWRCVRVDISVRQLELAREDADRLQVGDRVEYREGLGHIQFIMQDWKCYLKAIQCISDIHIYRVYHGSCPF